MGYNDCMAIILMLGWWYGHGWVWILRKMHDRLQAIGQIFAVRVLLRTLFSPWKQIYSPTTFSNFLRNAVDNAVSRGIGTVVRGTILFWAFILSLVVLLIGALSLLIWPLLPLLTILLPVLAIKGVSF